MFISLLRDVEVNGVVVLHVVANMKFMGQEDETTLSSHRILRLDKTAEN